MCIKSTKYTIKELTQLHQNIVNYKSQMYQDKQESLQISRNIKICCEILIRNQNLDDDCFDYFCENKMIELFYELYSEHSQTDIVSAILEGFSLILINVSRKDWINYILSQRHFLKFQIFKLDDSKNQVTDYFINFLKTLAQRITAQNIHMFFHQNFSNFPLLWQTIRFYNHPESLIRNTSRNIVLSIITLHIPLIDKYLQTFPFTIYYSQIINQIKSNWKKLERLEYTNEEGYCKFHALIQEDYDLILYISDLIKESSQQAKNCIINSIVNQLLLFKLIKINYKQTFKVKLLLYHVWIILDVINNKQITQIIMLILFGKFLNKEMVKKILEVEDIGGLASCTENWSNQTFWDDYQTKINNFTKKIFQKQSNNIRVQFNINDSIKIDDIVDFFSNESTYDEIYQKSQKTLEYRLGKTPQKLFRQEKPTFESEVEKLSKYHGKSYLNKNPQITLINIKQKLKFTLKQNKTLIKTQFQQNTNKDHIFNLLNSQDQGFISILIEILLLIFKNKVSIDAAILFFCGLKLNAQNSDFYNEQNLQLILFRLLNIFQTLSDFKLLTFSKCLQLIQILQNQNPKFQSICKKAFQKYYKQKLNGLVKFMTTYTIYDDIISAFKYAQKEFKKNHIRSSRIYKFSNDYEINYKQSYERNWKANPQDKIFFFFTITFMIQKIVTQNKNGYQQSKKIENINIDELNNQQKIQLSVMNLQPIDVILEQNDKSIKCYLTKQNSRELILVTQNEETDSDNLFNYKYSDMKFTLDNSNKNKLICFHKTGFKHTTFNLIFQNTNIASLLIQLFEARRQREQKNIVCGLIKQFNKFLQIQNN